MDYEGLDNTKMRREENTTARKLENMTT